jgi:hypothetical protein
MVLSLVNLPAFTPINSVTPFTYRDNATYLTILHKMQEKVAELITTVNSLNENTSEDLNKGFVEMVIQLNTVITALHDEFVSLLEAASGESLVNDPTTGVRSEGLSRVVSNVYDNTRIFAYFAKQFDDLQQTAISYDALELSARHFDLGITYPTLNDVLGV